MKKTSANYRSLIAIAVVLALIATSLCMLPTGGKTSAAAAPALPDLYARAVPDIDVNLAAQVTRLATGQQQAAAENFKAAYGPAASVRWNNFSGSTDVVMNFHTAPSADTPENVARGFVNANSGLFGIDASSLVLERQTEALGGYLLRFKQVANGLDVANGGIGILMNDQKQIRMVMGSPFRGVSVANATPSLTAALATTKAEADISRYANSNTAMTNAMAPGLDSLAEQLAPALRAPKLNVFPTADGYKLAWDVITLSRNPFGLYLTQVDANTGEILYRHDVERKQTGPIPYQADIYPNTPGIANYDTGALRLDANGEPDGLLRVQLRGYNEGMNVTSVNGTFTGPHALVQNGLATKQPYAAGATGNFFFRHNNPPLEAQPNEADDRAEPAEHIDGVEMFFFINYLLEYVDDIHKRDDNTGFGGQGAFPDSYPSSDRPLVGIVHVPNIGATSKTYDPYRTNDPVGVATGYDNAGSFPLTQEVDTPAGHQQIVINPTIYGHGYLLNDLAKDGPVAYHEGMHSLTTPIAGWEGTEGAAMNEGQADSWMYTITGENAIGVHSVNGSLYRARFRARGIDPDTIKYIRSAESTLKYSTIGTWKGAASDPPAFEEHKDGEVFAATMFELRKLMIAAEPQMQFKRPGLLDGQPTKNISRGQESYERLLLGQAYILGLSNPDTMVNARDAIIQADRILYPTDASDLEAPGQHEALIWQVFAAREIGANAQGLQGGVVTISTAVPQSAVDVPHTSAPQGVVLTPGSTKSVKVSWQPVSGAYAYQVFKRRKGTAGQRQYKGIPGRPYFDGDQSITGWTHVGYSTGNSNTTFEDKGSIHEVFAPEGIKSTDDANGFNEMFDTEYAVRAISYNSNRSSGFSDLSASATFTSSIQDLSSNMQTTNSNIAYASGIFQLDVSLRNNGVQAADTTAYGPINFKVMNISSPTVTPNNKDSGGDGHATPANWLFPQSLAAGQTSTAKTLKFNDPGAQLFTFDAAVTGRVRGDSIPANGSQPYDGTGGGQQVHTITTQTDTYSGTIPIGTVELKGSAEGVDYVDVPFTALPGSFGVTGVLTAGTPADLDMELVDSAGHVLDSSGNPPLDSESCSAVIQPGQTYYYRVYGYVALATPFTIQSTQFFSDSITGGSGGSQFAGTQTSGVRPLHVVRFTINPLTKAVTTRLL
ncbi:MAG TPA: M36 family metallopeptidase [Pyrinomonadaceae bacterium]|nr:M36 family metallopeptidase [Pyrinomonadaceae bacterium]